MTFAQWQVRSRLASDRATRVARMIQARADRAACAAGLDRMRNMWFNAMLAYACGRPWREVDYSKLRLAIRLDQLSFRPGEIADAYSRRLWALID